MQAYSDNQADDVKGNGFHLLLYISYQAIKRAEEEGGGSFRQVQSVPPFSHSPLHLISHPSSSPHLARAH